MTPGVASQPRGKLVRGSSPGWGFSRCCGVKNSAIRHQKTTSVPVPGPLLAFSTKTAGSFLFSSSSLLLKSFFLFHFPSFFFLPLCFVFCISLFPPFPFSSSLSPLFLTSTHRMLSPPIPDFPSFSAPPAFSSPPCRLADTPVHTHRCPHAHHTAVPDVFLPPSSSHPQGSGGGPCIYRFYFYHVCPVVKVGLFSLLCAYFGSISSSHQKHRYSGACLAVRPRKNLFPALGRLLLFLEHHPVSLWQPAQE